MNKGWIAVVLCVVGSIGSCAALGTAAYAVNGMAEALMTPALQAFVNVRSPFVTGQIPF